MTHTSGLRRIINDVYRSRVHGHVVKHSKSMHNNFAVNRYRSKP